MMSLCFQKTGLKENISKIILLNLKKNRVKSKWLEKMNQLKKHILFFDFLENHYVSNDEVSKQHLSVIKKSNFVKANDKSTIRFIYIYINMYMGKKSYNTYHIKVHFET